MRDETLVFGLFMLGAGFVLGKTIQKLRQEPSEFIDSRPAAERLRESRAEFIEVGRRYRRDLMLANADATEAAELDGKFSADLPRFAERIRSADVAPSREAATVG